MPAHSATRARPFAKTSRDVFLMRVGAVDCRVMGLDRGNPPEALDMPWDAASR